VKRRALRDAAIETAGRAPMAEDVPKLPWPIRQAGGRDG